jgi:hypothetical protein
MYAFMYAYMCDFQLVYKYFKQWHIMLHTDKLKK